MPDLDILSPAWLRRVVGSLWGAAFVSALATALLALVATAIAIGVLHQYGWILFLGVPLFCGWSATRLYTPTTPPALPTAATATAAAAARRRPYGPGILAMTLSLLMLGVLIMCVRLDGLICILMAFPLAWVLGLFGVLLAHALDRQAADRRQHTGPLNLGVAVILPLLMYGESRLPVPVPTNTVTTTLDIAADPATVWRYVPALPTLPPPTETVFRLGIAYPVGTRMHGTGVGAARDCLLSTGVMRERVTVWEPERRLRFEVLCTPCALREISIYRDLEPPHVHEFTVMREGEIRLVPLPGGGTRLVGTSRYEQRMWPAAYWMLYSDYVVHAVHRRVFGQIKTLAERESAQNRPSTAR